MNNKQYKTELHCHSKEVSTCSVASAESIVEKYLADGYSTVVLTNHLALCCHSTPFFDGMNWEEKANHFINGYKLLKKAAEGTPLNILFGAELCFPQYENHYLLFGLTQEYLLSHEDIYCTDVGTFHRMSKEDGLILIHAHPMRPNMHIVYPWDVDGYEVYNGNPSQNSANNAALEYAKTVSGAIMTSGSDHHGVYMPIGGIITDFEIKSNDELLATLRGGNYSLIRNEERRLKYRKEEGYN